MEKEIERDVLGMPINRDSAPSAFNDQNSSLEQRIRVPKRDEPIATTEQPQPIQQIATTDAGVDYTIVDLLTSAVEKRASDLHLTAGSPPCPWQHRANSGFEGSGQAETTERSLQYQTTQAACT